MSNLIGVVLCGGQSIRMGKDKGLLKIKDKTWAGAALEKLKTIVPFAVISINEKQKTVYSKHFGADILVEDNMEMVGPATGMFSVHLQYPENDLLVLACDMVDMYTDTLEELIATYKKNSTAEAYIYKDHRGMIQPMPGIYRVDGIKKAIPILQGHDEKKSLKYMLENLNLYTLSIPLERTREFSNYNTPEEWSKTKR